MQVTPQSLCFVLAIVLFAVAAFWTPPPIPPNRPVNLVAAGLALLALGFLLG